MKLVERIAWVVVSLTFTTIFVGVAVRTCRSAEISLGYSQQPKWNPAWCTESRTQHITEVELQADEIKPWTFSVVGQYLQCDDTSGALHLRLGLKQVMGRLAVRLFGGFGLHSGHQPEIGKSQVIGHLGAGVGLRIGHVTTINYSIVHMSDPLQRSDFGWNYQLFSIGMLLQ